MEDFEPSESKPDPTLLRRRMLKQLKLLGLNEKTFAYALSNLGDYRSIAAITRSIRRMLTGDTTVSGEIVVILKMLSREHIRRKRFAPSLEWKQGDSGSWTTNSHGYSLTLYPRSRGRWLVQLVNLESGYSPPWPQWQESLSDAKAQAVQSLFDALVDHEDFELEEAIDSMPDPDEL